MQSLMARGQLTAAWAIVAAERAERAERVQHPAPPGVM
jgi:hypothetical protein